MLDVSLRLNGLQELLEKERTFGAKTEGFLTDRLLELGKDVQRSAQAYYEPYTQRGADAIQEKVFATSGLWVVQTLRKSRDLSKRRPNFGPLMMRKSFLPAARDNEAKLLPAAQAAVEEARAFYWDR